MLFATAIPHCCHIINVSTVEDFSGVDVNNNYVAVKKEKTVFDMILQMC